MLMPKANRVAIYEHLFKVSQFGAESFLKYINVLCIKC